MEYFDEVLNRKTGELERISQGDWVTVTELADIRGVGPRHIRTYLRRMDILVVEGTAKHVRHRLASWVVHAGLGRRIERRGAIPFDVIGPDLRRLIDRRWEEVRIGLEGERSERSIEAANALGAFARSTGRTAMTVRDSVAWLTHHFPNLTHEEIATILDVTRQLVGKYVRLRSAELSALRERAALAPL